MLSTIFKCSAVDVPLRRLISSTTRSRHSLRHCRAASSFLKLSISCFRKFCSQFVRAIRTAARTSKLGLPFARSTSLKKASIRSSIGVPLRAWLDHRPSETPPKIGHARECALIAAMRRASSLVSSLALTAAPVHPRSRRFGLPGLNTTSCCHRSVLYSGIPREIYSDSRSVVDLSVLTSLSGTRHHRVQSTLWHRSHHRFGFGAWHAYPVKQKGQLVVGQFE
jgi:hypothetical protein